MAIKKENMNISEDYNSAVHEIVKRVGDTTIKYLSKNSPSRTGALKKSWQKTVNQPEHVEIESNLNYARWVNDGTGVYGERHSPITPTHAKFLRWKPYKSAFSVSSDGFVYAKKVRGQRGQHMIEKTVEEVNQVVPYITNVVFNEKL